jgi:GMP synthase PP-ATPase subunit
MMHKERVEALVHKELDAFKLPSKWCKIAHREFFEVCPEVALQSVERWKRFVDYAAYIAQGTLDPDWAQRVERIPAPSREEIKAISTDVAKHHQMRNQRYNRWLDYAIRERGGGSQPQESQ